MRTASRGSSIFWRLPNETKPTAATLRMQFDRLQAERLSELEQEFLHDLAVRLNAKKEQLENRGWRGEGVYHWLCLIAGRYIRRYRPACANDPSWTVGGWHIGRNFNGPLIGFDITRNQVYVDTRDGAAAWVRSNRI